MRDLLKSGTFWFSVAVVVVLGVGAGLSAAFWGDLSGPEDNKEALSTTVRNVMLMLAALLALPLAIWRGWVAERQVRATQDSVGAAHIAIANQRFQAAAQMLGSEVNAVRLGAIDTLAALANEDSERYYIQSTKLLAAFIRDPFREGDMPMPVTRRGGGSTIREDVSSALDFIGSRAASEVHLEAWHGYRIDLSGVSFGRVDLRGLNLSRTTLNRANLSGARCGGVDFSDSDLSHASLSGAHLRGVTMRNAKLSGANFSASVRGVEGQYEDYSGLGRSPAVGLVQKQLDEALDDQEEGPMLRGVKDAGTGEQLLWHGRQPDPS